jgi:tungstate transport system ATP-binding protein
VDQPLGAVAALSARDLVVRHRDRVTLDIPQLDIAPGEVLAVIGPNGAGKTTLLLHLALLARPKTGAVLFDGEPTRGRELALRRRMAMVFQEALLLDRTVLSNVETGLRLRGVPANERRARAAAWLRRFGIESLALRSPRSLSGGEAQRVSLARAFALQPQVMLLDEPFSALDQPTREAIINDLAVALTETGVTAVIVTHDRDEAAQLGDRVAVLIDGRVRQAGTPSEVFGEPADEEIAAFVGIETIVRASVVARADGLVTLAAGRHQIEAVSTARFDDALVCLRPEDVSIGPPGEDGGGSARNHLPGTVIRVVPSGADCRIEVDCGFRVIARVTRRSSEEMRLAPGMPVVASFKATAVHVIPK